MSYQVLARKWRPRTFAELSGQEHVVQALTNALTRGRLHHAYLLTGTRGVGKTTIARILAKSLNCATGVTATPCGVCPACMDIDAGRFVDLLELDAASNTGIDDMREILDNARYAPTVGRYKVYLIDEVHQLSKSAFNSMLKTLEEPPEHVKFVLATTDPQKIPVTVLSRCLQFNLKALAPGLITARLAEILTAESIAFDAPALALVARGAAGSMRDGLSLLDQAIAYGNGEVREAVVREMLGAVDTNYVYRIADALVAGDGAALLAETDAMAARTVAFDIALDELASLWHRVAVAQAVPAAAEAFDDADAVAALARALSPELVQLAYQIAVQGRADLALAPDAATGFAMTLLRLRAFAPGAAVPTPAGGGAGGEPARRAAGRPVAPAVAATTRADAPPVVEPLVASVDASVGTSVDASSSAPLGDPPAAPPPARAVRPRPPLASTAAASPEAATAVPTEPKAPSVLPLPVAPEAWPAFVAAARFTGIAGQIAAQSELIRIDGPLVVLAVPASHKHLVDPKYADKLRLALEQASGRKLKLAFEIAEVADASLAAQEKRERAEAKAKTEAAFRDEPFVRDVVARFDAKVRPDSVKPVL
jgi:DNA polymerase-3 subunit gamma/tau